MRPRQLFLLTVAFLLYILLGSVCYMNMESKRHHFEMELQRDRFLRSEVLPSAELRKLSEFLSSFCTYYGNGSGADSARNSCELPKLKLSFDEPNQRLTFMDSIELTFTTVTTIGYGHISPLSAEGRVFTMIYSVLGIPFCALILAVYADALSKNLIRVYNRSLRWFFNNKQDESHHKWIIISTCVYLAIGFLVFVFFPAVIFSAVEKWSYVDSVYYAVVSVSTIGYGDLIPARSLPAAWHYRLFVCVWVAIGLSYWITVLNFLNKLLKSKRIKKAINRRASEIRDVIQRQMNRHGSKDHEFLSQHSKGTFNLMIGLSVALSGKTKFAEASMGQKAPILGIASLLRAPETTVPETLPLHHHHQSAMPGRPPSAADEGEDQHDGASSLIIITPEGVQAVGGDFFPFHNPADGPCTGDAEQHRRETPDVFQPVL